MDMKIKERKERAPPDHLHPVERDTGGWWRHPARGRHPHGCLPQPSLGELGAPGQAGCAEVAQQGPTATGCFPGVVETLGATLDHAARAGAAGAGQAAG